MPRYEITEQINTQFEVRCIHSTTPPFIVDKIYKGKNRSESSENEFVLAEPLSYGGVNYDCVVLEYDGIRWKFEKV